MSEAQRLFQVAEMQWIENDKNIEKSRDTEMQKHDRAWPFCWARETATSATFYVGIYDRHTYAVVTSPQWSSNSQAGSAYDTVVWHWKWLLNCCRIVACYCEIHSRYLKMALDHHNRKQAVAEEAMCAPDNLFFCQLNSLRMTQTFRLKKWSISNYKTHRRAQAR